MTIQADNMKFGQINIPHNPSSQNKQILAAAIFKMAPKSTFAMEFNRRHFFMLKSIINAL